jgi:SPOR domain
VSDDLSIPRGPIYRVRRARGPDPMTRRLMLIAGGLTGALVLIVVAWSSVGHHSGAVPVVQADQTPVRVRPANPGGMQIPGLSADTGSGDGTASADKLAPAPETPDPQALARQTVAAPAVTPSARTSVSPGGLARPAVTASTVPAPRASVLPSVARPAAIVPAVADLHPMPPAAQPLGGRTQVQLAALATEAAARQEWDRLTHRMPDLFGTRRPVFSRIDHDGQTLWRVRTGDFATEADASQFCQTVRAKGGGCAVAAF